MPISILDIIMDIIAYSVVVSIILISILVIFNIKLSKALRIFSMIVSVITALIDLVLFGIILNQSVHNYTNKFSDTLFILCTIAIFITMLTYIRQALHPEKK